MDHVYFFCPRPGNYCSVLRLPSVRVLVTRSESSPLELRILCLLPCLDFFLGACRIRTETTTDTPCLAVSLRVVTFRIATPVFEPLLALAFNAPNDEFDQTHGSFDFSTPDVADLCWYTCERDLFLGRG